MTLVYNTYDELIDVALAILEMGGWKQGQDSNKPTAYTIFSSLLSARSKDHTKSVSITPVVLFIIDNMGEHTSISMWNDDKDRDYEEVVKMLTIAKDHLNGQKIKLDY